ncbi:membrane protein [Streptomyces sp. AS58]|uniref:DUF7144 domain-containing protein n=1 Tax=Streptomyces cadmiisoli TaxID=2184053 RepID=A0A2Z4IZW6_9ACTN|nr:MULTISPECIES: hypothetical protein [Streptomyces]AWW38521.1 hypothetical protein DN051_19215 [Streptomyces cadmiisoli]KOV73779.1 membrane protein [Streptomyces sp. AS58]
MTEQPHPTEPPVRDSAPRGTAPPSAAGPGTLSGSLHFAGMLLALNGVLRIFEGIAAIAEDDVYARIGAYIYEINLTGWGWILLILGVIGVFVGWGVLQEAGWARVAGVVLAALGLIAQFLFLPYAPLWSLILIALDLFVIWALAAHWPKKGPAERTA